MKSLMVILFAIMIFMVGCSPCGKKGGTPIKRQGKSKITKIVLIDIYTTDKGRIVIVSDGNTNDYVPSNVSFKFDSKTNEPYVSIMKVFDATVVFKDRKQYREYMYSETEQREETKVDEEEEENDDYYSY